MHRLAPLPLLLACCVACSSGPLRADDDSALAAPRETLSLDELRRGDFAGVLHGSGPLWDPEEHEAYRQAFADTPPLIVRFGFNLRPLLRAPDPKRLADLRQVFLSHPDQIPLLTLKFDDLGPDGKRRGLERQVLDGHFDALLVRIAGIVRDAGRPVFVRIGPECNGSWHGYSPELFPQAFRYVADALREHGAENTIIVWNVKLVRDEPVPVMRFYPGDEAVDWWSVDIFGEDFRERMIQRRLGAFLTDARERGKPVMIPESCPSGLDLDDASTWERWFEPYFALIDRDDTIKAFCYSNRDFASEDVTLTHWGDMRIDRHELRARYAATLRNPRYRHAAPLAATTREPTGEATGEP